jgi:hypothetical protein
MTQQKIEVVRDLMESLDNKDFDLDVWKAKTKLLLRTIFGTNDEKITLVENLHYDYSSWALRDTSGGQKGDKVKEFARQILEVAITELSMQHVSGNVITILQKDLTGAQFSLLMASAENQSDPNAVHDFLKTLGQEKTTELLVKIIKSSV